MPMEGGKVDISGFTNDQLVEFIKDEKNDRDTKILCFRKLVQAEGQE